MNEREPAEPVVIKTVDNGPYQVKGPIRVIDHDNNQYELGPGRTRLLCRCGQSADKPWCDGAHVRTGFAAAERAVGESGG